MQFIKAAQIKEFEDSNYSVKKLIAKKIAIIKRNDETFYAVEISCKHQGANLLENEGDYLKSNIATCPRHHWKYDLETGECLSNSSAPLRIFPIDVRGDNIYVGFEM